MDTGNERSDIPALSAGQRTAAMEAKAKSAVIESGEWLTAAEIADLAGLSRPGASVQLDEWKDQGRLFAIQFHGTDYYPVFALDREAGFRPISAVAKIIEIFADHKSAWGMAFWCQSVNSFLGGKRPQDLLTSESELVIEAAFDEIQGVVHG